MLYRETRKILDEDGNPVYDENGIEKMEITQEYEIPDIPGLTLSPEELISQKQDELLKIYNEIQELKNQKYGEGSINLDTGEISTLKEN